MLNGTPQEIAKVRELIRQVHDAQVENAEEYGNAEEIRVARRGASIEANLTSMALLHEPFSEAERNDWAIIEGEGVADRFPYEQAAKNALPEYPSGCYVSFEPEEDN